MLTPNIQPIIAVKSLRGMLYGIFGAITVGITIVVHENGGSAPIWVTLVIIFLILVGFYEYLAYLTYDIRFSDNFCGSTKLVRVLSFFASLKTSFFAHNSLINNKILHFVQHNKMSIFFLTTKNVRQPDIIWKKNTIIIYSVLTFNKHTIEAKNLLNVRRRFKRGFRAFLT